MRRATDYCHFRHALSVVFFLALGFFFPGCSTPFGDQGGVGNFHTVIVDAGHGGDDRGGRAISGQHEKSLALDTAQRLARILRSRGFHVIETRTTDRFIPLGNRTEISNRAGGAIFVSIHYNWARRSRPRGIEIYYYNPRSRALAANILQQTLRAYPSVNRSVKRNNFYVLTHNKRPAVLCELGFLSNPQDNRFLQNADCRQHLAERIADGISASRR